MISNRNEQNQKIKALPWVIFLSQILSLCMIGVLGVWLNSSLGGFAWDGSSKEFNLHPLLMVCGLVFLYGESAIVYRALRSAEKIVVKRIHAGLFSLAFVLAIIGLVAVFDFHNANNIRNMYSLHSWCGITTVILFALQLVCGLFAFLLPTKLRQLAVIYMPTHRFFGSIILMFATITCLTGINEKLFFVLKGKYQQLGKTAILGNVTGLLIVAYVTCILYILYHKDWQRNNNSDTSETTALLESEQNTD